MAWNKGISTKSLGVSRPVKTKIKTICITCGKVFESWRASKRKFCSRECMKPMLRANIIKNINTKESREKGLLIRRGRPLLKMRGDKHPNWRGGAIRSREFMNRVEYKNWRKAVFERDNYTCRECGKRECFLMAHHIVHWSESVELRYVVDNGLTLCKSCHYDKYHQKVC